MQLPPVTTPVTGLRCVGGGGVCVLISDFALPSPVHFHPGQQ